LKLHLCVIHNIYYKHVIRELVLYKALLFFFSCLHRASTVSKHFIIPTDAHNYKITGMLKTIKIPIIGSNYRNFIVFNIHV